MTYDAAFSQATAAITGVAAAPPVLDGDPGSLPARLPVEDLAAATIATALTTAAGWRELVTGHRPEVGLHRDQVAAAMRSEAYVRLDGAGIGGGFAPLSRFWPAADGWVRTHANYEWHRLALLRALGIADGTGDVDTVGAVLAGLPAAEIEARVFAAGGLAVAVRGEQEWRPRPALVTRTVIADSPARTPGRLRVLDLTRVIAGPVGTRFLAALGAEVLRIDPPTLPELPLHVADGLVGKRSALLDLRTGGLGALLDGADVVVHGYRPGALERFGLDAEGLAARHRGIVSVGLSAWGREDPRRGFDSLVQAACGIALIQSHDGRPGALPCQLLDHGTGYLMAAAALDGLLRQRSSGGTHSYELSLAATATWAMSQPRTAETPATELDVSPWLTTTGRLTAVAPPGTLDGELLRWPSGLPAYGGSVPSW